MHFSLEHAHTHTDACHGEGAEKAENEGVQAVTVNINGDSICGINVAHLGGRSREKTAALRGSDEKEIQQTERGREGVKEEVCLT